MDVMVCLLMNAMIDNNLLDTDKPFGTITVTISPVV